MRVIFVAGLPGSGKTTWATAQAAAYGSAAVVVDDPSVNPLAWDAARRPGVDRVYITDPHLCVTTPAQASQIAARHLKVDETSLECSWVCFENRPDLCLPRARPHVAGMMVWLNQSYTFPADATILPIPGAPAQERVDDCLSGRIPRL